MVAQALQIASSVLASRQDSLTSHSVAALTDTVAAVVRSPIAGSVSSGVPQSLLGIVSGVFAASKAGAVNGRLLTTGSSGSWPLTAVDAIGSAVGGSLQPGAPTVSLSAGSASDGSAISVR